MYPQAIAVRCLHGQHFLSDSAPSQRPGNHCTATKSTPATAPPAARAAECANPSKTFQSRLACCCHAGASLATKLAAGIIIPVMVLAVGTAVVFAYLFFRNKRRHDRAVRSPSVYTLRLPVERPLRCAAERSFIWKSQGLAYPCCLQCDKSGAEVVWGGPMAAVRVFVFLVPCMLPVLAGTDRTKCMSTK